MATERFILSIESRGTRRVRREIDDIGRSAGTTRRTLAFLRSALVVVASARVVQGLVEFGDSLTLIQNRLRLVTRNAQELTAVQNALFNISQRTRTSFAENAEFFNRLARSTRSLNLRFSDLLTITEAVGIAVKVSGASTTEAIGGIRQLSQALASGAAQGEELRSVVENLPRVADAIARQFGLAGGQLIAFNKAFEGAVKSEAIARGLLEEIDVLRGELEQVNFTVADAFQVLNNQLVLFLGNLSDATGAGKLLNDVILGVARNLGEIGLALTGLAAAVVLNVLIGVLATLNRNILLLGRAGSGAFLTLARAAGAVLAPVTLLRVILAQIGGLAALALSPLLFAFRALVTVATAFIRPLQTIVRLFGILRTFVLTNPLFLLGAAIVAALVAGFILFRSEIEQVTESLGGLLGIFNRVAAAGIATVRVIIDRWRELPAAFGDVAIQAANSVIAGLEGLVQSSIRLLNEFVQRANRVLPESLQLDFLDPVDFGRLENDFAGSAARIGRAFTAEFERALAEDPAGSLEDAFRRALAFVRELGATNLEVDESLLENFPDVEQATGKLGDDADELKRRFQSLLAGVSPLADAFFQLKDAEEAVAAAGQDLLDQFGLTRQEVLRRVRRDLLGVGNAEVEVAEKAQLLEEALRDGAIAAEEFNIAMIRLEIEGLEESTSGLDGFRRALLELQEEVADTASSVADLTRSVIEETSSAIADLLLGTETSFEDFLRNLARQFIEFGSKDFLAGVSQLVTGRDSGGGLGIGGIVSELLFGRGGQGVNVVGPGTGIADTSFLLPGGGGGGGFLSNIFGDLGSLFGFQSGVEGASANSLSIADLPGIDNRLVAFRARAGETIDVNRSGEGDRRQGPPVIFNITTPDADSFRRSQTQIANRSAAAIQRANRRR